jgi:hydrogenase nickel incorporation protein HypA/HybF
MHEIGLVQSTLELAHKAARESGATRIHVLRLRVGALTGVVPEAFEFAFEALRRGTLAEQATLEIETIPARSFCSVCRSEFASDDLIYSCPRCATPSAELRSGLELELVSMEIT